MFKLKIINKPKMIKMKCNIEFPDVVLANLQEKEVIPTKEKQEVIADSNYDGLSKVIVDKIPNEYIIPQGQIDIIKNGIYDVTDKVNANVSVPEKQLGTKTITSNGTYKAIDDGLDGYSEVEVSTSGVDINEYLSDTITAGTGTNSGWSNTIKKLRSPLKIEGTSAKYMFSSYPLPEFPEIDTSEVTDMSYMYYYCNKGQIINNLNTSKVTNMNNMFNNSKVVINCELDMSNVINMDRMYYNTNMKIPKMNNVTKVKTMRETFYSNRTITSLDLSSFNTSELTDLYQTFRFCSNLKDLNIHFDASKVINTYTLFDSSNLTNLTFLYNYGKGFSVSQSANYYNYRVDVTTSNKLTHDSLMSIINGLYDIASLGIQTQQVFLGRTNLAKLTSEEVAIATNKGWTVS